MIHHCLDFESSNHVDMSRFFRGGGGRTAALVCGGLALAVFAASLLCLPTSDASIDAGNHVKRAANKIGEGAKKQKTLPSPEEQIEEPQEEEEEEDELPQGQDNVERLPFCPPPSDDPSQAR